MKRSLGIPRCTCLREWMVPQLKPVVPGSIVGTVRNQAAKSCPTPRSRLPNANHKVITLATNNEGITLLRRLP